MAKGWLDNYNDSKASAPEGFEGEGYSMKGRNYSPAWGGQFQEGGKLTFLQPTSDKLPQGYRIPYSDPSSERAMSIGGENGEPAYLIPSFKYGKPLADPIGEFRKTKEHLGGPFKTWQEADEWENETRHPAVEKGENIMFPQEQFQLGGNVYPVNYVPEAAMGMSMPGAVGFTYARTQGAAPSNGKYAKKTKASAQNGKDIHGSPITAIEKHNPNKNRSYYDPRTNVMNLGTDYDTWADKDSLVAHENYHAKQHKEERDNFDIAHHTDNEQWARMQKRPEMMSTNAVWNNFYNRKPIETDMAINAISKRLPESQFFPQAAGDLIYDKIVDQAQYDNPNFFEGEAQYYENTGEEFQNGGEMRYYQQGLDFQPKTISKNGSWLSKYEEGGVIKDDRGQWAHPGEITEIGSNDITMEGVPYDVLGISDTGDTKLMKPGKDYKFKGKKVTEYPMAKDGLRQEQKSLQNLDNLTNFTNYNKPQPGGWLNKYN